MHEHGYVITTRDLSRAVCHVSIPYSIGYHITRSRFYYNIHSYLVNQRVSAARKRSFG